jgi:uncharacterized protein
LTISSFAAFLQTRTMDLARPSAFKTLPAYPQRSIVRAGVQISWLMLTLHCALASEPADARTRAEPAAGFANPAISTQALDNSPLQIVQLGAGTAAGYNSPDRTIERDLAQLLERANNNRASVPPATRRPGANRIDTNPIANAGDAAWLLGLIYAHGAGVGQDFAQAQLWFDRALARGQNLGAVGLAWCAVESCKQATDVAQARVRIASIRAQLPARALYLEWWLQNKTDQLPMYLPTAAPAQTTDAADKEAPYRLASRPLLEQAARLGDIHALIELGLEAVALGNKAQARPWFEQAAAGGSGAAAHNLRLLDQQQASSDPSINSHVSMDAATVLAMAQRNHRGLGQPTNYTEAIRLYRLAQARGSTAARDMLALIFSRPTASGQLDIAWMQRLAALNIDKSAGTGGAGLGNVAPLFQRERTPLFDFLPALWKKRAGQIN